ncbi:hypothetical protein [Gardnerella vaginalis]|uniref:Uncharacterized protein n=1 Tax=Gardnerella vaginalis (strain ATCC 14019 / 317) TaxID=525284 RepID=E3D9Z2_GARV3|nr:hypothetical protein [Gardnerella vaginalis]ADP38886.1 hypothetical protein HMPREF0421_20804 [Gardnerella vaginalis ATCC 14019]KOS08644.1 hypothetical protein AM507_04355 [Gardnerella vaginalis]RFT22709.1 hypothetical protein CG394_07875 [Gardnerella vaginalis]TCH80928.1 hypothetical protein E0E48_01620 [Gardnerella vaginalis]TCH82171.1 hypothetical protein E0E46_02440 [Gardnerella vaginalis ATCC 14018 = JCM 11026]
MNNTLGTIVSDNYDENDAFWEVVKNDFTANDDHPTFKWNDRKPLPVYEGSFLVGSSHFMATYHVSSCFNNSADEELYLDLALRACKVACIASDISRGRPISSQMRKALSEECIFKLENMWYLISQCFSDKHDEYTSWQLRCKPTMPRMINGMLISPTRFEAVVLFSIGSLNYCASLAFKSQNGSWICTLVDLG